MAARTGVSVRTLDDYDEIGLLCAERSPSVYRLYDPDNMVRFLGILLRWLQGQSLDANRIGWHPQLVGFAAKR